MCFGPTSGNWRDQPTEKLDNRAASILRFEVLSNRPVLVKRVRRERHMSLRAHCNSENMAAAQYLKPGVCCSYMCMSQLIM